MGNLIFASGLIAKASPSFALLEWLEEEDQARFFE